MSYQAYATWCRNLDIEPATEERWSKLRDRAPYPDRDNSRPHGPRIRRDRGEVMAVDEFMEQSIGTRLAYAHELRNGFRS